MRDDGRVLIAITVCVENLVKFADKTGLTVIAAQVAAIVKLQAKLSGKTALIVPVKQVEKSVMFDDSRF